MEWGWGKTKSILSLKRYLGFLIMGEVKYYYLMITSVFLRVVNGLDRGLLVGYWVIVGLIRNVKYYKKKNKDEKNNNKRAFCIF